MARGSQEHRGIAEGQMRGQRVGAAHGIAPASCNASPGRATSIPGAVRAQRRRQQARRAPARTSASPRRTPPLHTACWAPQTPALLPPRGGCAGNLPPPCAACTAAGTPQRAQQRNRALPCPHAMLRGAGPSVSARAPLNHPHSVMQSAHCVCWCYLLSVLSLAHRGYTFSPPRMMTSFRRPTTRQ